MIFISYKLRKYLLKQEKLKVNYNHCKYLLVLTYKVV